MTDEVTLYNLAAAGNAGAREAEKAKDDAYKAKLLLAAHMRQEHGMNLRTISQRLTIPYGELMSNRDMIEGSPFG